ncbi:hypothetical protein BDQ12DRAFT_595713, partial [Crucibulum laeve]
FWNNTFGNLEEQNTLTLSCWQIWHTFIQESIQTIATADNENLTVDDGLSIDELTKIAFSRLGDNGIIHASDQHSCDECTHPYKSKTDVVSSNDPAAVVGVDENTSVPGLQSNGTQETLNPVIQAIESDINVNEEPAKVVMRVIDGIVMGPQCCAFEECTNALQNAQGGAFCEYHEHKYGVKCRVKGCKNQKKTRDSSMH